MGRITTPDVQNITDEVLTKYPLDSFTDKFKENKDKLKAMPEEFPSKKVLNRVAGRITRLFIRKREDMKKLLEGGPEIIEEEDEEELM